MNNANKFLKIALVLLLITNIALVAFMLLGKPGKGRKHQRPDITEMLAKEVGLSEEQKTTHRQMMEEHRKQMKPYMDSLKELKVNLYSKVKTSGITDSLMNTYTSTSAALQAKIDAKMFTQLKKVRDILQPQQQGKFDSLVVKMMSRSRRDSSEK